MKRAVFAAVFASAILSGCGTPQYLGMAPQGLQKPDEVCILLDTERLLPKLPQMIQKAFEDRGITAHLALEKEECPCTNFVGYRYTRKWDLVYYLESLHLIYRQGDVPVSKSAYISSYWSASKYSEQDGVDNAVRKLLGEKKVFRPTSSSTE